jgi:hypothetical protein
MKRRKKRRLDKSQVPAKEMGGTITQKLIARVHCEGRRKTERKDSMEMRP